MKRETILNLPLNCSRRWNHNERNYNIIKMLMGGSSYRETAVKYKLSHNRIRQIYVGTINRVSKRYEIADASKEIWEAKIREYLNI